VASLGRVVAQTRTARSILEQRGVYPARTAGSQALPRSTSAPH
jgi:hypothetical protein